MNAGDARRALKILLGKKQETSLIEDILPSAAGAVGTFAAGEYLARRGATPKPLTMVPLPPPVEEKVSLWSGISKETLEPTENYLSWMKQESLERRLYDADAAAGRGALRRFLARRATC